MSIISKIFIGILAIEHLYILWVEMFAWTRKGPKIFKKFSKELFNQTKEMASNMGLYNGFLSAGLLWSLLITDQIWAKNISIFFVSCVILAGFYGAITAEKSIFVKQALPAIITMILIILL
ncbi:MAG: DUF1304 domain-containing protein [Tepidibacter sp.]|jgi:putative membrane protein|uniref:DUF1304 domain-containing protein n=1 Tax=Tepidibacter sp. TaxID=2529387 RepID=UPI0025E196E8|nr:DUF1304 domain-containing protein [Tepidibacter sp.]MCT4508898.1 DUF1304 domain-containing protein [Tepidibacter sp.]